MPAAAPSSAAPAAGTPVRARHRVGRLGRHRRRRRLTRRARRRRGTRTGVLGLEVEAGRQRVGLLRAAVVGRPGRLLLVPAGAGEGEFGLGRQEQDRELQLEAAEEALAGDDVLVRELKLATRSSPRPGLRGRALGARRRARPRRATRTRRSPGVASMTPLRASMNSMFQPSERLDARRAGQAERLRGDARRRRRRSDRPGRCPAAETPTPRTANDGSAQPWKPSCSATSRSPAARTCCEPTMLSAPAPNSNAGSGSHSPLRTKPPTVVR